MTNALPHEMSRAERRRFVVRGLGRAVAMTIALVAVYFVVPLEWIDGVPVAVVLFIALFCGHPLDGPQTSGLADENFIRTHYGDEPLFSMHPTDKSNRPTSGPVPVYWDKVYPLAVLRLFERTFTEGLTDPTRRVAEGQWIKALTRLREYLGSCPGCGGVVFYDPERPERVCWSCTTPLGMPLTITHGKRRVVVGPELALGPNGTLPVPNSTSASAGNGGPIIAQAVTHPRDRRIIGLTNRTTTPWQAAFPDGEVETVAPNSSVATEDGLTITDGAGLRLVFSRGDLSKPA